MKFSLALVLAASASTTNAFAPPTTTTRQFSRVVAATAASDSRYRPIILSVATEIASESTSEESSTSNDDDDEQFPPILQELREVAMKLHTREQSPKEGEADAPAKPKEPYVPNQMDYLRFLMDSEAVYAALEEIVNGDGDGEEEEDSSSALAVFRNSGLERTDALEKDIAWMCEEFDLERPEVGMPGRTYAEELRGMVNGPEDVPEFVCHFYNYYFAHIAGGRMIGKQMSKLLLDGETLEFYKWDENVNELKPRVKAQIEELARQWSREERDNCINATAGAFRGGGAINGYLYGGSPH